MSNIVLWMRHENLSTTTATLTMIDTFGGDHATSEAANDDADGDHAEHGMMRLVCNIAS